MKATLQTHARNYQARPELTAKTKTKGRNYEVRLQGKAKPQKQRGDKAVKRCTNRPPIVRDGNSNEKYGNRTTIRLQKKENSRGERTRKKKTS